MLLLRTWYLATNWFLSHKNGEKWWKSSHLLLKPRFHPCCKKHLQNWGDRSAVHGLLKLFDLFLHLLDRIDWWVTARRSGGMWYEGGNRTCSIMFHQLQDSASVNSMSTFNILLKFYKVSSSVSNLAAWTSGKNITWDRRKSTSSKKLNPWMLCRSLSIQTPCTPLYRPISAFVLSKIPIVLQL